MTISKIYETKESNGSEFYRPGETGRLKAEGKKMTDPFELEIAAVKKAGGLYFRPCYAVDPKSNVKCKIVPNFHGTSGKGYVTTYYFNNKRISKADAAKIMGYTN